MSPTNGHGMGWSNAVFEVFKSQTRNFRPSKFDKFDDLVVLRIIIYIENKVHAICSVE